MNKFIKFLAVVMLVLAPLSLALADRNVSTIEGVSTSQLIKNDGWKLYRVTYTVTAASGHFEIYDCATLADTSDTNIKTEGSEAVSLNGKIYDFTNKPIEGNTGLYIEITDCNVVIEYE